MVLLLQILLHKYHLNRYHINFIHRNMGIKIQIRIFRALGLNR